MRYFSFHTNRQNKENLIHVKKKKPLCRLFFFFLTDFSVIIFYKDMEPYSFFKLRNLCEVSVLLSSVSTSSRIRDKMK